MSDLFYSDLVTKLKNGTGFGVSAKNSGKISSFSETISVASGELGDVGDTFYLCPFPKNLVPTNLIVRNSDLDAHSTPTLDLDIGIGILKPDGTVTELDPNFFAADDDCGVAANLIGEDLLTAAGNINLLNLGQKTMYDILGASVDATGDENGMYVIIVEVGTNAAATDAAGTLQVEIKGKI